MSKNLYNPVLYIHKLSIIDYILVPILKAANVTCVLNIMLFNNVVQPSCIILIVTDMHVLKVYHKMSSSTCSATSGVKTYL